MNLVFISKYCRSAILTAILCFNAIAAESSKDRVQPYLSRSTLAIARIDLTKTDISAAVEWVGKRLDSRTSQQASLIKGLGDTVLGSLKSAGVKDFYVSLSLEDLLELGLVVYIPCDDPAAVESLVKRGIEKAPILERFQAYRSEGLVTIAQERVWSRISSRNNGGNEELLKLLDGIPNSSVALALVIPERLRDEVSQVWPESLPAGAPIKASPKALMNDFRALRLAANISAHPTAAIYIDTASADAVERFRRVYFELVLSMAEKLNSRVEGNTFVVNFEEPQLDMALQLLLKQTVDNPVTVLRQIGIAVMEYEQKYHKLPPRETRDKEGKSLLSWCVHVLPYLGQQSLYDQFHLDEPWDSLHNAALIPQMPPAFALDADETRTGKTRIQFPMLEGAAFFGDGPQITIANITDGAANTILVVQAPKEKAVIWTKPEDLQLSNDKLMGQFFEGAAATDVMFFDGAVHRVERTIKPELLKAMITMAGNDYALQAKEK